MSEFKPKLIHAAKIRLANRQIGILFLKQLEPFRFVWFQEEKETEIWGGTCEEAMLAAYKKWRVEEFQPFNCGFRYTLPERDEVGSNALLHQMISSYNSMNGVYFDEELGSNCIVQNASSEARKLWKKLQP